MDMKTKRGRRAALVLAAAAAVMLLSVPAGFGQPTDSNGLVATNLGSQDPRDTAQSASAAGLVPTRLGSPDPRDTARNAQKSDFAPGAVAGRLGSPDPRGTANEGAPAELRGPVRPDGAALRAYFDSLATQASAVRPAPTRHESRFSWRDAGIGAGAVLLFGGGVGLALLSVHHNRRRIASPA